MSKYSYPYIEENIFCPLVYHLASLAYTKNWTEFAMLGVGEKVDVIHESVVNLEEAF